MTNNYEAFTQKLQNAVVQVGATSGDYTIVAAPGAGKESAIQAGLGQTHRRVACPRLATGDGPTAR